MKKYSKKVENVPVTPMDRVSYFKDAFVKMYFDKEVFGILLINIVLLFFIRKKYRVYQLSAFGLVLLSQIGLGYLGVEVFRG